MYFSSAKAERELGYRSRPAEAALGDALDWYRAAGSSPLNRMRVVTLIAWLLGPRPGRGPDPRPGHGQDQSRARGRRLGLRRCWAWPIWARCSPMRSAGGPCSGGPHPPALPSLWSCVGSPPRSTVCCRSPRSAATSFAPACWRGAERPGRPPAPASWSMPPWVWSPSSPSRCSARSAAATSWATRQRAGSSGSGLVLFGLLLFGFAAVQRHGLFSLLARRCGSAGHAAWQDLDRQRRRARCRDQSCYRDRRGLVLCTAWRGSRWLAGSVEVWLALMVLGRPIALTDAIILESLGQVWRSAGFFIPGGLGAQESGILAGRDLDRPAHRDRALGGVAQTRARVAVRSTGPDRLVLPRAPGPPRAAVQSRTCLRTRLLSAGSTGGDDKRTSVTSGRVRPITRDDLIVAINHPRFCPGRFDLMSSSTCMGELWHRRHSWRGPRRGTVDCSFAWPSA